MTQRPECGRDGRTVAPARAELFCGILEMAPPAPDPGREWLLDRIDTPEREGAPWA